MNASGDHNRWLEARIAEGELLLLQSVISLNAYRIWNESSRSAIERALPDDARKLELFDSPRERRRTTTYQAALKNASDFAQERREVVKEQIEILKSYVREIEETNQGEPVKDPGVESNARADEQQRHSRPAPETRDLVVLIHGIRTGGRWMRRIKPILEQEADCVVEPAGFGFFDSVRFLLPGLRRRAIETVKWKVQHAINAHPDRQLIIIAHSFGTYCVTQILKDNPQIRPVRMIFCGSIVAQDFRWDSMRQMEGVQGVFILNECGARDIWPPLAHSMTFGYGASGTGGFQVAGVTDRCHDLSHSDYFKPEFVSRFWVPFVKDGTVAPSDFEKEMKEAPWWISAIGLRPVFPWFAWFLVTAMIVAALCLVRNGAPQIQILYNGRPPQSDLVVEIAQTPINLLQGFALTNQGRLRTSSLRLRVAFNGTNFAFEGDWANRGSFGEFLLNLDRQDQPVSPGEAWPLPGLQVNVGRDYFTTNVTCKIMIFHDGGKAESPFQIRPAKSFRNASSSVSLKDSAKVAALGDQYGPEPKISCRMRLLTGFDLSSTNPPSTKTRSGKADGPDGMETTFTVTEVVPPLFPGGELHLHVLNEGPIKVLSLSVFHKMQFFWSSDGAYAMTEVDKSSSHESIMLKPELLVGLDNEIDYLIPSHVRPKLKPEGAVMIVHVVDLVFYREKDMKRFSQRELFLEEGGRITDQSKLKSHQFYPKIMNQIAWLDTVQGATNK